MKRKLHASIAAASVGLLLIAGTFAWTNFSASIINNFFGAGAGTEPQEETPGGTLHNDFEEGKDYRDVYVENWGSEPLIVRIRLSEYMEIGEGAGNKNGAENNQAVSIIDGASMDDVSTWTRFNGNMGSSPEGFRHHWNWTMGGQKLYFPAPEDLRGTRDENGVEFVSTRSPVGVLDDDIRLPDIYMTTLNSEVISMDEWISRDMPIGNYWVVDTDGFSYWAAPLAPNDATGLLLHKVELVNVPEYDYFYAINVEAHMATVDDEPDNYQMLLIDASSDASILVNRIADRIRGQEQQRENFEVVHTTNILHSESLEPILIQSGTELRNFNDRYRHWFVLGQMDTGETNYDGFLLGKHDNYFNDRAIILVSATGSSNGNFDIGGYDLYYDDVLEIVVNTHTPADATPDIINRLFVISIDRSLIRDEVRSIRASSTTGPGLE